MKEKSKEELEAMCERCGRCCFEKLIIEEDDILLTTNIPCRHLDLDNWLCTVYDRRHEVNPRCADLEKAIDGCIFPADCPYVRDIPGYMAPEHINDHPEYEETVAEVFDTEMEELRQMYCRGGNSDDDNGGEITGRDGEKVDTELSDGREDCS